MSALTGVGLGPGDRVVLVDGLALSEGEVAARGDTAAAGGVWPQAATRPAISSAAARPRLVRSTYPTFLRMQNVPGHGWFHHRAAI